MTVLHVIDSIYAGSRERRLAELLQGPENRGTIKCGLVILSEEILYLSINR